MYINKSHVNYLVSLPVVFIGREVY